MCVKKRGGGQREHTFRRRCMDRGAGTGTLSLCTAQVNPMLISCGVCAMWQARQHLEDVVHAVASHQRTVAMAGGGDVSYNELPNTLPELEQRVEQLVFAAFDQEDRLSKKALQMCDTPDNASGGHGGSSDPTVGCFCMWMHHHTLLTAAGTSVGWLIVGVPCAAHG